jgi:hypothetical protein
LPARSVVDTDRRIAREVVIAVARSTDTIHTADDDVGRKRVAGAESTVGVAGRADELTSGGVVDDLGRGEGSRCRDDDSLNEHVDLSVWLLG